MTQTLEQLKRVAQDLETLDDIRMSLMRDRDLLVAVAHAEGTSTGMQIAGAARVSYGRMFQILKSVELTPELLDHLHEELTPRSRDFTEEEPIYGGSGGYRWVAFPLPLDDDE